MQFSLTALIIDDVAKRKQSLETICDFLKISTQSGDSNDCLSYLDSAQDNIDLVFLGQCKSMERTQIVLSHPRTPFILLDDADDKVKESPNFMGEFGNDPSYDELVTLLHYCQSFNSMKNLNPKFKDNKSQRLIKLLVGKGEEIAKVRRLIEQVAPTDASVLILGESGTGKEVVARAIHELSNRSKKAFVPVNCGAIPPELLESELFGHEKGAFTGAISAREGRFELAEGGTLFLDEIGDMPFNMQVKLLRVLQERKFERVGSNKSIKADVRIIAATHQNLEKMVEEKSFREDLYYRLNVFPIETPPLRERTDDLPLLITELTHRHSSVNNGATIRFTQRALSCLMQNEWKGNVRELSNLVERMLILHPNEVIDINDLPPRYRGDKLVSDPILEREALLDAFGNFDVDDTFAENADDSPVFDDNNSPELIDESDLARAFTQDLTKEKVNLKELIADIEVKMIKQALEQSDGVVAKAAETLGLRRTTLFEKMKKYNLS